MSDSCLSATKLSMKKIKPGYFVGGLVIGIAIGVMLHNLAVGVAIGVALGGSIVARGTKV